jgi:hypothetical protein
MTLRTARPGLVRVTVCAVVVTIALGACSDASHRYVRNTDVRSAFMIPSSWATFDEGEVLGTGSGPQPSTPDPLSWLVGIDASPSPSPSHILNPSELNTDHPTGVAMVQEFSFVDRDEADFAYMRNYIFPVDQLIQNTSDAQVLAYDDALVRDGFRGVHLVVQFRSDAIEVMRAGTPAPADPATVGTALGRASMGGTGAGRLSPDFVTVNQVSFIDEATSHVYFFTMLCSAACYDRNRGDIESTVDSWTVQPA